MQNTISISMMCVDVFEIKSTMQIIEQHNIDYIHIDIMDGKFVPNLGIGCDFIKLLQKNTKIPIDYHIMAYQPRAIIELLDIRKSDVVSVHYESCCQVKNELESLRRYGCKILLAISPMTSLSIINDLISYIDGINLLMVTPGFAGQKILPHSLEKAIEAANLIKGLKKENFIFEVDGNISFEYAKKLKEIGANMFVAGSSSIFSDKDVNYTTQKLIDILEN